MEGGGWGGGVRGWGQSDLFHQASPSANAGLPGSPEIHTKVQDKNGQKFKDFEVMYRNILLQ